MQTETPACNFSTANADYRLIGGSHSNMSRIDMSRRIDAVILEGLTDACRGYCFDQEGMLPKWWINAVKSGVQSRQVITTCEEKKIPIYHLDYYDSRNNHLAPSTKQNPLWVVASAPTFLFKLYRGDIPVWSPYLIGCYTDKIPDHVSSRNAVLAEKAEKYVIPNLKQSSVSGRKPFVLIDYAGGHIGAVYYFLNRRGRQRKLIKRNRTGFFVDEAPLLNVSFRFDFDGSEWKHQSLETRIISEINVVK